MLFTRYHVNVDKGQTNACPGILRSANVYNYLTRSNNHGQLRCCMGVNICLQGM